MSDNTVQYRWIVTIKSNLDRLFAEATDVFVAADLLWYAVEGDPKARQAPDVLVAFGRPKGDRGSYRQWQEGGAPPQVVFEILSPGNRAGEMERKWEFYDRHGVEEYYILDPKDGSLSAWIREPTQKGETGRLRVVEWQGEHVSPRLGVRFVPQPGENPVIYYPDNRLFLTVDQIDEARARAESERDLAEQERTRAETRADRAEVIAEQERERADRAEQERERLLVRLRELGIDPAA